jgi:hypothetical protein
MTKNEFFINFGTHNQKLCILNSLYSIDSKVHKFAEASTIDRYIIRFKP